MMYFKLFANLVVGVAFCFGTVALAQETEEQAKPEVTAARKAFDVVFEEWKSLLSEMRLIRAKSENAEDEELPSLQKQFDELIAKGETIVPNLRNAAIEVYNEAPNQDNQISRWLASIANDYVAGDNFDAAKPALDALVAGETTDPTVYNNAAICAFVANDYEASRVLIQKAAESGALTELTEGFAFELENYEEFWKREKQLRDEAASAEGEDRLPVVKIVTTQGDIIAELFENEAPETVGNFISLIEKGFYDGRTFHRVIGNFMVQGGCPKGDGTGTPGYQIYCECVNPNHRKHFAGTLSMAHSGRDTGGSQFFMTHVPTAYLNGKHTVFGRITEGFDVLAKIKRRDPDNPKDLASEPDKIIKVDVVFKRNHEYKPNKK